jgi:hypothetical protein
MGPRLSKKVVGQSESSANAFRTKLVTPWMFMLCDGAATVRILDELEGLTQNYRHKVQYRTASVPSIRADGTLQPTSTLPTGSTLRTSLLPPEPCGSRQLSPLLRRLRLARRSPPYS